MPNTLISIFSHIHLSHHTSLWLCCHGGLVVLHYYCISYSQFQSVLVADHHASCWAACCWRNLWISGCTTIASVDEELSSSTHFAWLLGIEVERARSRDICVHYVFAVTDFVPGGWERASVNNTLHIRVVVSWTLPAVSMGIDAVVSRSPHKFSRLLVIGVCHWQSWRKFSAAILKACLIGSDFVYNDGGLGVWGAERIESNSGS